MTHKALRLGAVALTMMLLATPVGAKQQRVYVKVPGVTATQMNADHDACVRDVLATMNGPHPPTPRPVIRNNGDAIASAFDLKRPRMAAALEVRCMADRGYALLPLTPEEDKALAHARGLPARDAWYDALVATDLSARITASNVAVPPSDPAPR